MFDTEKRAEIMERGLKEIMAIAEVSDGQAAAFYAMLAKRILEE